MFQILNAYTNEYYATETAVVSADYCEGVGEYSIIKDNKWQEFVKEHNLQRHDNIRKWYDLYLRLCGEGLC